MTTQTTAPNPALELLQAADLASAAGELRKGYHLVWEATMAALEPLAAQHGFPCATREQATTFALYLDEIGVTGPYENYPHYHFAALNVSCAFLEQAEGQYDDEPEFRWEGNQYEFYLPAVKSFIADLLAKANTGKASQ